MSNITFTKFSNTTTNCLTTYFAKLMVLCFLVFITPMTLYANEFPILGNGVAVNAQNESANTNALFMGGISINAGTFLQTATLQLTDMVNVAGSITVAPEHVGQLADISVYAAYRPLEAPESIPLYYMLDTQGAVLAWDGVFGNLVPFQTNVSLSTVQPVQMYSGNFILPGLLNIHFAYHLIYADGYQEWIYNPTTIDVTILPTSETPKHRVSFGHLAGAVVEVFKLENLQNPIFNTLTNESGNFGITADSLTGLNPTDLLLVKVTKGQNTDLNLPNQGAIHALVTVAQLVQGTVDVSLVSDIGWLYTQSLVGNSPAEAIPLRLDDIAKVIFETDVNGDGNIRGDDLIAFNAADNIHLEALTFNYQRLLQTEKEGVTLLSAYPMGNNEVISSVYAELFSGRLVANPMLDSRVKKKQLTLTLFGDGQLLNQNGEVEVQSHPLGGSNTVKKWLEATNQTLQLEARPAEGYEFLYWTGCDLVSDDNTQCAFRFNTDKVIGATFGIKTPEVVPNVFDLSGVSVSVREVTYTFMVPVSDSEFVQKLSAIQAGDYIVSGSDGGFLRKVSAVQKLSDSVYVFTTADAALEDVIVQGSVAVNQPLTVEDMESFEVLPDQTTPAARSSVLRKNRAVLSELKKLPLGSDVLLETATEGVYLKRSVDPREIILVFGQPENRSSTGERSVSESMSITVVIYDEDGDNNTKDDQVRVQGEVTIKFDTDFGLEFTKLLGLRSFREINTLEMSEKLTFEANYEVISLNSFKKIKNQTIFKTSFDGIPPVFIGPVPIVLTPMFEVKAGIDVNAVTKIKIGYDFKMKLKTGVSYNANAGLVNVNEFEHQEKPDFKPLQVNATIKPILQVEGGVELYKAVRLSVYGDLSAKFEMITDINREDRDECPFLLTYTVAPGIDLGFKVSAGIDDNIPNLLKLTSFLDSLRGELKWEVYKKEWIWLTEKYSLGTGKTCGKLTPSKLYVDGSSVTDKVIPDKPFIETTYTVTNLGDQDLDWEVDFLRDNAITVSPISGNGLKKGENATVSVKFDTSKLTRDSLSQLAFSTTSTVFPMVGFVGTLAQPYMTWYYRNSLRFKNVSDENTFTVSTTDEEKGNMDFSVEVQLPPPPLSAPQLVTAVAKSSTSVALEWFFADVATLAINKGMGFRLYQSKNEGPWQLVDTFYSGVYPKLITILTGLESGSTYQFQMDAVTSGYVASKLSNIMEVTLPLPSNPPIAVSSTEELAFGAESREVSVQAGGPADSWLTVVIDRHPSVGTLGEINGLNVIYHAPAGYVESYEDSFDFYVVDDLGQKSNVATLTLQVKGQSEPLTPPRSVLIKDNNTAQPLAGIEISLWEGHDNNAGTAKFFGTTNAEGLFTPVDLPNGQYTVVACKMGSDCLQQNVTIDDQTVMPVLLSLNITTPLDNTTPPEIIEPVQFSIAANSATVTLPIKVANFARPGLMVKIQQPTQYGTLTPVGGLGVTYAPASGFVGEDSFAFTVEDGTGFVSKVVTARIKVYYSCNTNDPVAGQNFQLIEYDPKVGLSGEIFSHVLLKNGTLDLAGQTLTIHGHLIQAGGTLNVNKGTLIVKGSYCLQTPQVDGSYTYSNGLLQMINETDNVLVNGDFVMDSQYDHNGRLRAGLLEVKGNFTQQSSNPNGSSYNIYTTGTHKVKLSGVAKQTINMEDPASSCFNSLEITHEDVVLTPIFNVVTLINHGYPLRPLTIEPRGWTLQEDQVIKGDLNLKANTLDVNGKTLTIQGNLLHGGGTLYVNGGKVVIAGDYRLQTPQVDGSYTYSNGLLQMINETDNVLVNGDFVMDSQYDHNGRLRAGLLEVKGNFTQQSSNPNGSSYNIYTTGTHKVKLSGVAKQTINMEDPASSCFNSLEITHEDVVLTPIFNVVTLINHGYPLRPLTIEPRGWTLQEDQVIKGDLNLKANTLDVNGKTLTIQGNLLHGGGTLYVNGGKVVIAGDYRLQTPQVDGSYTYSNGLLQMINETDNVLVNGDFVMDSQYDHNGRLRAGLLEVKGNFTQQSSNPNGSSYNIYTTGTHKVKLSGVAKQTINMEDPASSCFNSLEITHEDVVLTPIFNVVTLINHGYPLRPLTIEPRGWTLQEDQVIKGDLNLKANTLDVNGKTLTIQGNLLHGGGTLYVNGGKVVIAGDYRLQTPQVDGSYTYSNGLLQMINETDNVLVNGDFVMDSQYDHNGRLRAGLLEVKGNFTQQSSNPNGSGCNFYATGTHKVIVSGSVSFEDQCSHFNNK